MFAKFATDKLVIVALVIEAFVPIKVSVLVVVALIVGVLIVEVAKIFEVLTLASCKVSPVPDLNPKFSK